MEGVGSISERRGRVTELARRCPLLSDFGASNRRNRNAHRVVLTATNGRGNPVRPTAKRARSPSSSILGDASNGLPTPPFTKSGESLVRRRSLRVCGGGPYMIHSRGQRSSCRRETMGKAMHIQHVEIGNFRKLQAVRIDFSEE